MRRIVLLTLAAACGAGGGAAPEGFDAFQRHNLDVINGYRARAGVAPLALDARLSQFALAGSVQLSQDHLPHQHFSDAGDSLWTSGFTSLAGENQGDPDGWGPLADDPVENELAQIDAIQAWMVAEGPGTGPAHGHYANIMSPDFRRLGVGLVEVGGLLYLTNDFSD